MCGLGLGSLWQGLGRITAWELGRWGGGCDRGWLSWARLACRELRLWGRMDGTGVGMVVVVVVVVGEDRVLLWQSAWLCGRVGSTPSPGRFIRRNQGTHCSRTKCTCQTRTDADKKKSTDAHFQIKDKQEGSNLPNAACVHCRGCGDGTEGRWLWLLLTSLQSPWCLQSTDLRQTGGFFQSECD